MSFYQSILLTGVKAVSARS